MALKPNCLFSQHTLDHNYELGGKSTKVLMGFSTFVGFFLSLSLLRKFRVIPVAVAPEKMASHIMWSNAGIGGKVHVGMAFPEDRLRQH